MDDEIEPDGIAIEISDTQAHVAVDRGALQSLACFVLESESRTAASISLALVDNAAIEPLNGRFLGHAGPTDVISFLLSELGERVLAGEVVVSAEMAAAVAGEPPAARDELALYVVHGLLHLCGYDDQSPAEAALMHKRQAELLDAWKLTRAASAAGGGPVAAQPAAAAGAGRERLRWSV